MQLEVFVSSGQGFCSKHQGRFLSGDAVWLVQDLEAASVIMDSGCKPTTAAVIDQIIMLKCSFSMIYKILFSPGFGNTPEYFFLIEMLKGIHAQVIRGWGSEPNIRDPLSTQKLLCKERSYVAIMAIPNRFPAVTIKKISRQVRCNFYFFVLFFNVLF